MSEIFHITHDANNWNEYDSGTPPGAKLALSVASALGGSVYGVALDVGGAGTSPLRKSTDAINNSATYIRFGFRLNLNTTVMDSGTAEQLFELNPTVGGLEFCTAIWLRDNGGSGFNIEVENANDGGSSYPDINTAGDLPSGDITIEVAWEKPASTSSNDGVCTIYVNGVQSVTITTLDNFNNFADMANASDLKLDAVSTGGGSDSGLLYLDEFTIRDDSTPIFPDDFSGYDLVIGGGQP